jgi:hypothetical protein
VTVLKGKEVIRYKSDGMIYDIVLRPLIQAVFLSKYRISSPSTEDQAGRRYV